MLERMAVALHGAFQEGLGVRQSPLVHRLHVFVSLSQWNMVAMPKLQWTLWQLLRIQAPKASCPETILCTRTVYFTSTDCVECVGASQCLGGVHARGHLEPPTSSHCIVKNK